MPRAAKVVDHLGESVPITALVSPVSILPASTTAWSFAMRCLVLFVVLLTGSLARSASGADPAAKPPVPAASRLTKLPTEHPYQQTLRDYLGSLKEADFEHGVTVPFDSKPTVEDPDEQYRHYLMTLMLQPLVGTKRGVPSINAPSRLFTLPEIETPEGVKRPPLMPDPVAQLIHWKYVGNPYYQSKALKLRAFVTMSIILSLLDEQLEHAPELGGSRSDWLAPTLIALAFPYETVSDAVPEPVRKAYGVGLAKMARRILQWGPKEEEPNMDVIACVALWYIGQAVGDVGLSQEIEQYVRTYFTDPRYFHPAGYFVDRGGIDLGFAGQTNWFASWLALASRWPFVVESYSKTQRLRAHLSLPHPDGKTYGPSHFHNRFSADAFHDQWEWGHTRDVAASLVTPEAAYLVPMPTAEVLAAAAGKRAGMFQFQVNENPLNGKGMKGYKKNEDLQSVPWRFLLWPSYNFPATLNFAEYHYPAGAYARRLKLEEEKSPFTKSPFLRSENFVRNFADAFTVTRQPRFAAIVHSGPVGTQTLDDSLAVLPGPYGFGGGQLSAFWTPEAGSLILGRRGGMSWDKNFDHLEDWRKWPIHAVSGARVDGRVFTTARIRQPEVTTDLKADGGTVRVQGVVPRGMLGQGKAVEGRLEFARTFTLSSDAVQIETKLQTTSQDNFAELFETLPVFLRDGAASDKNPSTKIELRRGNAWVEPSGEWLDGVAAVRLSRFTGAAIIEFDRPRRVKTTDEWADTYLSRVVCRNIVIDLLETNDAPQVVAATAAGYRIRPETK
jgi:hypothetical protein